VAKKLI